MDIIFASLVLSIVLGFFGLIATMTAIAVAIALGYPKIGKEALKGIGELQEIDFPPKAKNRDGSLSCDIDKIFVD